MARSFSSAFEAERAKANGASIRYVLQIDHGGAIGTKYYAGEAHDLGDDTAEARVVDWGEQSVTCEPGRVGGYGSRDVKLADADGVLRTRFDSERPGIQGRRARVWLWFEGTTFEGDAAAEFDGVVGESAAWNAIDGAWSLKLVGIEKATEDQTLGVVLSRQNFPETACAGTEGRIIPICFGDPVRRVPAVLIDRPGFAYLVATLDVPDATLTLNVTADEGGFTSGTTISLLVGNAGAAEVITGSFASGSTNVFDIATRGCVYAEGTSPGTMTPNPYTGARYAVVPFDDLPGGSGDPSRGGYPILLNHSTRGWVTQIVQGWFNAGSGRACTVVDDGFDGEYPLPYKLLATLFRPVYQPGTPVAELAPYVYAVNAVPSRELVRLEARADARVPGPEGQSRSIWFSYNAAHYTVDLDDTAYNAALGRDGSDPGITTVSLANPPSYYGFAEDTVYATLRGTTDDGTATGNPITNPAEVIENLLGNAWLGNVDSARIDATGFAAAAGSIDTLCGFAITKERKLHDVCAELAHQAGCLYFWDQGRANLVKLPTGAGTSIWTADGSKIAREGDGPPAVTYAALPVDQLTTELACKFRIATEGPEVRIGRRSDDAVSELGRKTRDLDCWGFQFASSVASIGEFWLAWYLNRVRRVTFSTYLPGYHLQPGDVITVELADGTATWFGPYVGVVTAVKLTPADARRQQMPRVEVTCDVQLWDYEVTAIPASTDACLDDSPPELATSLLAPPGAVSDGISRGGWFGSFVSPHPPSGDTPRTPEAGGGTGARKLARLKGHVAGNATGITVDLCDDDWDDDGTDETGVVNGLAYYLLNVTGGTRVVIEQTTSSGAWRITWCEHGPIYRATVAANIAAGATGTATLLVPGSETSAGVTVTARNRYEDIEVPSGTKKFEVTHDGASYLLSVGECD